MDYDSEEAPVNNEPRVNSRIRAYQVLFIDESGAKIGVISTSEALMRAQDKGLDLVEINPKVSPPVCRALDYGKLKYLQKKKSAETARASKPVKLKEIQLKPSTDPNDINTMINHGIEFLEEGDKVKYSCKLIGRALQYSYLAKEKLDFISQEIMKTGIAKVEAAPALDGRNYTMILAPV